METLAAAAVATKVACSLTDEVDELGGAASLVSQCETGTGHDGGDSGTWSCRVVSEGLKMENLDRRSDSCHESIMWKTLAIILKAEGAKAWHSREGYPACQH